MTGHRIVGTLFCALLATGVRPASAEEQPECFGAQAHELVVTLRGALPASDAALDQVLGKLGLEAKQQLPDRGEIVVSITDPQLSPAEKGEKLMRSDLGKKILGEARPHFAFCLPKASYTKTHGFVSQWHLARIDADGAWRHTTGDPQWTAAVVDTGVDVDDAALQGRVWTNAAEGTSGDGDQDGIEQDIHGANFCGSRATGDVSDRYVKRHGTNIAGIIIGKDCASGARPLVPEGRVMAVKALETGDVISDDRPALAKGIDYAASKNVTVINASWFVDTYDPALREAIARATNVLFVAAVADNDQQYPVDFHLDNVIAVTSTSRTDHLDAAPGSLRTSADIAAPGDQVTSITPGELLSGSSFAAPMVTGTVLLVKALAPKWGPRELKSYVIASADHPDSLGGYSFGRLNAARATAAPVSITSPPSLEYPKNFPHLPGGEALVVQWKELFHSDACPTLDADLTIDGQPAPGAAKISVRDHEVGIDIARRGDEVRASVRLRCTDTQLATDRVSFSITKTDP